MEHSSHLDGKANADQPLLISAFALADEQHPELTEKLMESMQRASNMLRYRLKLEVQPAAVKELSSAFIHVKGTFRFALLGGEVLIAVLNWRTKRFRKKSFPESGNRAIFS